MADFKKILIVDDEPDVRFLISSMLKSEGHTVETGNTIGACKRIAGSFKPQIVLLDIDLPDGSGLDAIPDLKQKLPQSQIIIQSAHDTPEHISRSKELGASGFIAKPISKKKLLDCIKL